VLYHHAKFGGGGDRTIHVGCRCENSGFVCLSRSEAGALFVGGVHILNKYCVAVYGSILILLLRFSDVIALSEALESSYFRC